MPPSRRFRFDLLAPAAAPRWAVDSDLWRNPLASRPLVLAADLRAALQAHNAGRHADGWQAVSLSGPI